MMQRILSQASLHAVFAGLCLNLLFGAVIGAQAQTETSNRTWAQFTEQGGMRFIQLDFILPKQYRNGYVYFNSGANNIAAFILRAGLSQYPRRQQGMNEIPYDLADQYVKSGKAIVFNWNLGNSGTQFDKDTTIRSPRKGTSCLQRTCLTAPYFSQPEVDRILRSQRIISNLSSG